MIKLEIINTLKDLDFSNENIIKNYFQSKLLRELYFILDWYDIL